jgi:membrane fusion protein, multidrug efflux system
MNKRVILVVLGLVAVVVFLTAMKALQIKAMIQHGKEFVPPPATVTEIAVSPEVWKGSLSSVGTLTPVDGVTVSAELAGKVVKIAFESGSSVRKGDVLIRQDTSSEEAQLPGLEAAAELARLNRERAERMVEEKIISRADHDAAIASYDQAKAQVDAIRTTIAKKIIRAPFSGRLGVRQANLGQMLREGDPIVSLESLDPIYADFSLPQQQLAQIKAGQSVTIACDALPGKNVEGKITAISPLVDSDTRNIKIEATLANHDEALRPGMFVQVSVNLSTEQQVQVIPSTAVLYAPYSDSVFVIEKDQSGKGSVVRQQFVRVGEKRGDLVAIASGLKPGEKVVSTGVFKLRNGQPIVIDNSLAPPFQQSPSPAND